MFADLKESNRDEHERLRRGIAHKVSTERYEADQGAWRDRYAQLREDFDELKKAREEDAKRIEQAKADRAQNRKWVIAAVLIPVVIGFLEIYFAIKGVK